MCLFKKQITPSVGKSYKLLTIFLYLIKHHWFRCYNSVTHVAIVLYVTYPYLTVLWWKFKAIKRRKCQNYSQNEVKWLQT